MANIKIRRRANPFVQIDKNLFLDRKLSWKAKGVMGYLLAQHPDWDTTVSQIVKAGVDGRDSVRKAMQELELAGYAEYISKREDNGTISGEWVVYEEPLDIPRPRESTVNFWLSLFKGKKKIDLEDIPKVISHFFSQDETEVGKSDVGKSDVGKTDVGKSNINNNNINNNKLNNNNNNFFDERVSNASDIKLSSREQSPKNRKKKTTNPLGVLAISFINKYKELKGSSYFESDGYISEYENKVQDNDEVNFVHPKKRTQKSLSNMRNALLTLINQKEGKNKENTSSGELNDLICHYMESIMSFVKEKDSFSYEKRFSLDDFAADIDKHIRSIMSSENNIYLDKKKSTDNYVYWHPDMSLKKVKKDFCTSEKNSHLPYARLILAAKNTYDVLSDIRPFAFGESISLYEWLRHFEAEYGQREYSEYDEDFRKLKESLTYLMSEDTDASFWIKRITNLGTFFKTIKNKSFILAMKEYAH